MGEKIEIDGVPWPTTEHYFQAQKFVGTPYVNKIRNSSSPRDAFSLSRDPVISHWRRSDWEEVKMDVMRKALYAKFTQQLGLKQTLIRTENRKLVERSPYDSFWGDGGNGTGQNHLGKLLMELRAKLQGDVTEQDGICNEKMLNSDNSSVIISHGKDNNHYAPEVSTGLSSSDNLQRLPLRSGKNKTEEKMETDEVPVENLIDFEKNIDNDGQQKHEPMDQ